MVTVMTRSTTATTAFPEQENAGDAPFLDRFFHVQDRVSDGRYE
jgi:hypothetical protein